MEEHWICGCKVNTSSFLTLLQTHSHKSAGLNHKTTDCKTSGLQTCTIIHQQLYRDYHRCLWLYNISEASQAYLENVCDSRCVVCLLVRECGENRVTNDSF